MPNRTINLFPPGFLWGCATASHQVEGDLVNDWTRWEQTPGHIFQNQQSGRACEWWRGRYEEDFDRAAALHNNTQRISIEWSRIEPEAGKWDDSALNRYGDMLKALHTRGMKPMVTLHHYTHPLWFADRGGWLAEDAPALFERFVRRAVEALRDQCDLWCTINEPMIYATGSYVFGTRPPGMKRLSAAARVAINLLRGHVAAYRAIKALQPESRVGYAHAYVGLKPSPPALIHRAAWRLQDSFFNMAFLRAFRDGVAKFMGARPAEIPGIKEALDWVGLQYYTEFRAGFSLAAPGSGFLVQRVPGDLPAGPPGWGGLNPAALFDHIKRVWETVSKPVIISESGVPDPDDTIRPGYLAETVQAVWRALNFNFPVLGFYFWTLVDNFEWEHGYDPRFNFGLYKVDFATQARIARPSAAFYGEICAQNGLSAEMVERHAPGVLAKLFPGEPGKNNVKLRVGK